MTQIDAWLQHPVRGASPGEKPAGFGLAFNLRETALIREEEVHGSSLEENIT